MDKRFIEEIFPVRLVSKESTREKRIRHGHISTLHLWWARRPLASSRAVNYAALIPEATDEIDLIKKKNFIEELSKWENSLNYNLIEKAKKDILSSIGCPPKVLDPFSGGGAIPLEALRLGCKTYANDYNPVAALLEKCTLEYPQKFGNQDDKGWKEKNNQLIKDLNKWGQWILKAVQKELRSFYPEEPDGSVPIGYIWARTLNCQNPVCNVEIPLMRQFWLAKNKNKKVSLHLLTENKKIRFEIVGDGYKEMPNNYNPSKGTVSRAIVTCPVCGATIEAEKTRKLFSSGKSSQKLILVVFSHKKKGKWYRIATPEDVKILEKSKDYLINKRENFINKWNIDPVPNEPLPPAGTLGFRIQRYGILKWGDLFNSRQMLSLITFIEKIKEFWDKTDINEEYKKVIVSYLALELDKFASFNTKHAFWLSIGEKSTQIFSRHALPMLWDYVETNPLADSFGWKTQMKWVSKSVENLSNTSSDSAVITNFSATSLDYADNYFDAVFTDPPYYDNINYAELSDFFYVILKRILHDVYPEYFVTPLTPKSEELISNPIRHGNKQKSKTFFESNLKKSLKEIYRVLKPNGIVYIVYAHKSTEGWETLINAILSSGLLVTASWPIHTEMKVRLTSRETATLASSIYIIARKTKKIEIGWIKEIKTELNSYIPKKLNRLWDEGISGADFFIAAIGSSIEIFGKYNKVLDNKGKEVTPTQLLSIVRNIVTDFAVRQILHNGIADELSAMTKFYLLWRWNFQEAKAHFDEANKIAQSAGINLSNEWNKGFIVKKGEFIRVLGPHERNLNSLENSENLIDVLHYVCKLWAITKKDEMKSVLKSSSFGESEIIYKIAQAISETLPKSSSEKKLIEGFLNCKDSIITDWHNDTSQKKLV